jgi:hypothetical protein
MGGARRVGVRVGIADVEHLSRVIANLDGIGQVPAHQPRCYLRRRIVVHSLDHVDRILDAFMR